MKKLSCILLIDDNPDDIFFHERVIRKAAAADKVVARESGPEALDYLRSPDHPEYTRPDLIFLDINMPGMNGWEFLEEYEKLAHDQKVRAIVIMLTTSENPDDQRRALKQYATSEFHIKPLTNDMLVRIIHKYFP